MRNDIKILPTLTEALERFATLADVSEGELKTSENVSAQGSATLQYDQDTRLASYVAHRRDKRGSGNSTIAAIAESLNRAGVFAGARSMLHHRIRACAYFTEPPQTALDSLAYIKIRNGHGMAYAKQVVRDGLPYAPTMQAFIDAAEQWFEDNPEPADANAAVEAQSAKAVKALADAVKRCKRCGIDRPVADSVYETSWKEYAPTKTVAALVA